MKFRRTNKVGKFEVKKVKNKGAVSKNVVGVAITPVGFRLLPRDFAGIKLPSDWVRSRGQVASEYDIVSSFVGGGVLVGVRSSVSSTEAVVCNGVSFASFSEAILSIFFSNSSIRSCCRRIVSSSPFCRSELSDSELSSSSCRTRPAFSKSSTRADSLNTSL